MKKNFIELVVWQIKYPNCFFIENIIGDFQKKIMKRFPESKLQYRNSILFEQSEDQLSFSNTKDQDITNKIWIFENKELVKIEISYNSFTISSKKYSTYNKSTPCFRDEINNSFDEFLELSGISIIKRIGFRYTNSCPLPEPLGNTLFEEWYNSIFQSSKFDISKVNSFNYQMDFCNQDVMMNYREVFINKERKYYIDIDAFMLDRDMQEYKDITDKLHDAIKGRFVDATNEYIHNLLESPGDK